jgi:hypothetical protein
LFHDHDGGCHDPSIKKQNYVPFRVHEGSSHDLILSEKIVVALWRIFYFSQRQNYIFFPGIIRSSMFLVWGFL